MDHMEGTVVVFESKIVANARVHARTHATQYRIPSIHSLRCPMPHACKQVLNMCPMETMNIVVLLLSISQSLSNDQGPLPSPGSPHSDKIRSGYLTLAFSGAINWAEWLHQSIHNPCLLRVGKRSLWLHHPCLLRVLGGKRSVWLHHPCLLRVPIMVGREQYGYITLAFSASPWWAKINLERSGCDGNEQKACKRGWKWVQLGENQKLLHPQCGRSIKTCCQTTMMPKVSPNMGF